jgi:hypothetical protein
MYSTLKIHSNFKPTKIILILLPRTGSIAKLGGKRAQFNTLLIKASNPMQTHLLSQIPIKTTKNLF